MTRTSTAEPLGSRQETPSDHTVGSRWLLYETCSHLNAIGRYYAGRSGCARSIW